MDELTNLQRLLAESREREKTLQFQIEDLSDFIENASIPLHWVNGSGIITWANQAELDLLGYSREEYIGRHISNFHADKDVIEDILARLINKETLKNYPARLKCKNGKTKPVLINSNALWRDNEFVRTRCFTREITDIKLEEQRKVELINTLEEKIRSLKEENENLRKRLETLLKVNRQ